MQSLLDSYHKRQANHIGWYLQDMQVFFLHLNLCFPRNPLVRLHRISQNQIDIDCIKGDLEVTFAIFYQKLTNVSGHWYCA